MKLTLKDFVAELNGASDLPVTEKDLIRGVIAAGMDPEETVTAPDAKAHLDELAALVRSSLDTSGDKLRPTARYQSLGSTFKGNKNFMIGNALCAHAAYKMLKIPWLVDIETPNHGLYLTFNADSKQRPDFVGLDSRKRWYVFESKGRGAKPKPGEIKSWKNQARQLKR